MSENFIVDSMTWSFSRLESFYNCKLGWYKKYIECEHGCGNAFAEYGTLVHQLMEEYFKGDLSIFDLAIEYENRFDGTVIDQFPPNKYVDMRQSYYYKGQNYLENFDGLINDDCKILGVEEKVNFEIGGKPFIGFIDLLFRDSNDKLVFCDHKSATLKWKKNGEISKTSAEKMLMYKRQQYLYCKALIDKGTLPDYLAWNFFNDQKMVMIPFDQNEYEEALQWAEDTIHLIEAEEDFEPKIDYYYCHNLCDVRENCIYCDKEWNPEDE